MKKSTKDAAFQLKYKNVSSVESLFSGHLSELCSLSYEPAKRSLASPSGGTTVALYKML